MNLNYAQFYINYSVKLIGRSITHLIISRTHPLFRSFPWSTDIDWWANPAAVAFNYWCKSNIIPNPCTAKS